MKEFPYDGIDALITVGYLIIALYLVLCAIAAIAGVLLIAWVAMG